MSGRFVNKLVVERDDIRHPGRKKIYFNRYLGRNLRFYKEEQNGSKNRDLRKLIDVIYNNFKHLSRVEGAGHTKNELAKLLTSDTAIVIFAMSGDSIAGYIIANETVSNFRKLMHIYYLYTSPYYRGFGIATYMLNLIQEYSKERNIKALSLTYDTYNKPLTNFYLDNNFNYDIELRSYQRYDMLVKYI